MAHHIAVHETGWPNGRAIYSGAQGDVWHRKGTYKGTEPLTVAEVEHCVGIPVAKQTVTYQKPLANGDSVETVSKVAFLTVRQDTGAELGRVGPEYTVHSYTEALVEPLAPFVRAGLAAFDTAGVLFDGARAFVGVRWNVDAMDSVIRDVYGDEIQTYGLAFASMDGTKLNSYNTSRIRGVCHNMVSYSQAVARNEGRLFEVRHTKNVAVRTLDAVQAAFGRIVEQEKTVALEFRALKNCKLDKALWLELVAKTAAPDPRQQPGWKADSPRAKDTEQKWRDKGNRIFSLWRKGDGHTGDLSAWEAYNGLVQSMDHDTEHWRARSEDNRLTSLTDGPLAQIRNKVYADLLAYATK